jgi:hypothetical protein
MTLYIFIGYKSHGTNTTRLMAGDALVLNDRSNILDIGDLRSWS